MQEDTRVAKKSKSKTGNKYKKDNLIMILMCLPVILFVFVFSYLPMGGIIIAFKDYRFDLGILKSPWVGLKNIEFIFTSQDAVRITVNTVFLNALFIVFGTLVSIMLALLLFEISKKIFIKIYQTIIILPTYLSWVVVGYMTYIILNPKIGIINQILDSLGKAKIDWYSTPAWWPAILTFFVIWKTAGLSCVMYYATLMGIDNEYYEAAELDGANRFQQIIHISLPFLVPLITLLTILSIGNIFRADFGMFFNLTRDAGSLYSTTDVIDTYVFRALRIIGDIGMSSAVGLYQSLVGFVLILLTNFVVKKVNPDNSLF